MLDADPQVRFRLEVVDLDGAPQSTITVGDEFQLRVWISDQRTNVPREEKGVAIAYHDVDFDADLAVATAIIHDTTVYDHGNFGTILPGVIDEVGSWTDSLDPVGGNELLLYSVDLTAANSGWLTFVGNQPDVLPKNYIGVYGNNKPIPMDEIDFGETSVLVTDPKVSTVGLYDRVGHTFYLNNKTDGSTDDMTVFVTPPLPSTWLPISGDWDGDGTDTVGLYDSAGHTFYLNNKTDGSTDDLIIFITPPLPASWLPITGDWDGDGIDTAGLYDPTGHTFYLNNKTDGSTDDLIVLVTPPLPATWLPIAGDWDGDGDDTVGLYDKLNHTFYLNNKTDGSTDDLIVFVTPPLPSTWLPIAGDWDGDRDDTAGLYDPAGHTFYLNNKTDGSTDDMIVFVTPPLPSTWLPIAGDWNGLESPFDADQAMATATSASSMESLDFLTMDSLTDEHKDVNGDGQIAALDVLVVINFINAPTTEVSNEFRYDVNRDGHISSMDALIVINALNGMTQESATGESESNLLAGISPSSLAAWQSGVLGASSDALQQADHVESRAHESASWSRSTDDSAPCDDPAVDETDPDSIPETPAPGWSPLLDGVEDNLTQLAISRCALAPA